LNHFTVPLSMHVSIRLIYRTFKALFLTLSIQGLPD
jgi:hypothetical protein